ncbi:MAG: 1-(5-phosphoribosyl)-5-((5-phosphoribosylamino)methylideneamino) imidazole-4-carboxamide isomerase [Syntrophorhabdus sp. PtaB.Bin047]|nr:MAG: 1-(5-phosphoribosyl)-5-((5-phosphoribosylamino)methylideneamino) imidazole-4-carboxamide isomerase [Syntrophorhabdus sp. PtaB.Bin047]
MKALFAMDLMGGKTVRLRKGDFQEVTVYSDDPPSLIEEMVRRGARDFHIIDLDGARTGEPVHGEIIKRIRATVKGYMEVGGGIRTDDTIKYYSDLGIDGVIVGTRALEDEDYFEGLSRFSNIVLGLDLLDGKPMSRGWKSAVDRDPAAILKAAERIGIMAVLCTSIERDGMLTGPDLAGLEAISGMTRLPVIASGGVSKIDDVRHLKEMDVWAAIIGKAFYEGFIGIEEAMGYAD